MKVLIIGPEEIPPNVFTSSYASMIHTLMKDSSVEFIMSDSYGVATLAAKMLEKERYVKCTIYYSGDSPRHNFGKNYFKYKKCTTSAEVKACLLSEADITIGNSNRN